jgi:hypothetical protein
MRCIVAQQVDNAKRTLDTHMRLTIIVPHRGNPLGVWATCHSCEEDLEGTGIDYNFVVVTNGEELNAEETQCLWYLEKSGKLLKHIHSDEPLSPPVARQRGAEVADGDLLLFFDNHCLVGKRYFERVVADFERFGCDMLHSSTRFYAGDFTHYQYRLLLDYNFWGDSAFEPDDYKPYRIAAGGHGGFVVRRDVWNEVGGYGPEDLLKGYGGEELLFDLKMWRLGHNNYIDPKLIHWHYTGNRGYSRHYTDEYYVNMMVTAHVIGGEKWLYRLYDSFTNRGHIRIRPKKLMYELLEEAYHRSAQYAKELDSKALYSLDELLVKFREEQVAH